MNDYSSSAGAKFGATFGGPTPEMILGGYQVKDFCFSSSMNGYHRRAKTPLNDVRHPTVFECDCCG